MTLHHHRHLVVWKARLFLLGLVALTAPVLLDAQRSQAGTVRVQAEETAIAGFIPEVASMNDLIAATEDEQARARFFGSFGGEPLRRGDIRLRSTETFIPSSVDPPPYDGFMSHVACPIPMLVLGRAEPKRVRLNTEGTWLFTEHLLTIDRWLYPQDNGGEAAVDLVTPGGQVRVGGLTTATTEDSILVPNTRYLFALQPVPASAAVALYGLPVRASARWVSDLRHWNLPGELVRGDVAFDRFVDDLERARWGCKSAKP